MKLKDCQVIYVRSMGKVLTITALFTNDVRCNKYLESHKDEGVIAVFDEFIFVADLNDQGIKISQ